MKRLSYFLSILIVLVIMFKPSMGVAGEISDDDYRFIMTLAGSGFLEEAMELAEQNDDEKVRMLMSARVLKMSGDMAKDDAIKTERYIKALDLLTKYIDTAGSGDPKLIDAKIDKGIILQKQGEVLSVAIQAEADPTKRDELIAQASSILADAGSLFTDIFVELKDNKEKKAIAADVKFYQGANEYYRALCYLPGTDEREQAFKKAKAHFDDYMWDYTNYAPTIKVYRFMGHLYREKGKHRKASREYNKAVKFLRRVEKNMGGLDAGWNRTFGEMVWRTVKEYNAINAYDNALNDTTLWLEREPLHPNPKKWTINQQGIALEHAIAQNGTGDLTNAKKMAKRVAKSTGIYSVEAVILLKAWGVTDLDPYVVLTLARIARRNDPQTAIAAYSTVISTVISQGKENYASIREGEDTNVHILMSAYIEMSKILYKPEDPAHSDYYGGAVVLEAVVKWHLEFRADADMKTKFDEETLEEFNVKSARCASDRFLAFKERANMTKNPIDIKLANAARSMFTSSYPDAAGGLVYFQAKDYEKAANKLAREKKYKEAISQYEEAAKKHGDVSEQTDYYERGRIHQADCIKYAYNQQNRIIRALKVAGNKISSSETSRLKELRNTAVDLYAGYIEYAKNKTPKKDSYTARNRAKTLAQANYHIGSLYVDQARDAEKKADKDKFYDLAIAILADFDKRHSSVPDLVPFGVYYEIQALLGKNMLEQAKERLEYVDSELEIGPSVFMARAFRDVGNKLGANDRAKKVEYLKRWIELDPKQPLKNLNYVGKVVRSYIIDLEANTNKTVADRKELTTAYSFGLGIFEQQKTKMAAVQEEENLKDADDSSKLKPVELEQLKEDLFMADIRLGQYSLRLNDYDRVIELFEPIYDESTAKTAELEKALEEAKYTKKEEKEADEKKLQMYQGRIGYVAYDLAVALAGKGAQEKALEAFQYMVVRVPRKGERWWICKYYIFKVQAEGDDESKTKAKAQLKQLASFYPSLGDGNFLGEEDLYELYVQLFQDLELEVPKIDDLDDLTRDELKAVCDKEKLVIEDSESLSDREFRKAVRWARKNKPPPKSMIRKRRQKVIKK